MLSFRRQQGAPVVRWDAPSRMSASGDLEYVPVHESGARHVAADGDAFVGVPAEDKGDSGSAAAQRRKARHRYRPAPDAAGFGCQEGVTRNIRVESTAAGAGVEPAGGAV